MAPWYDSETCPYALWHLNDQRQRIIDMTQRSTELALLYELCQSRFADIVDTYSLRLVQRRSTWRSRRILLIGKHAALAICVDDYDGAIWMVVAPMGHCLPKWSQAVDIEHVCAASGGSTSSISTLQPYDPYEEYCSIAMERFVHLVQACCLGILGGDRRGLQDALAWRRKELGK